MANWAHLMGAWERRGVSCLVCCTGEQKQQVWNEKENKTQKKQKETNREGGLSGFPKPLITGFGGHENMFPRSPAVGSKIG